ncbi:MAG: putative inorganic carbon transporter subunit DabA [Acidimicrobiales bacterium]
MSAGPALLVAVALPGIGGLIAVAQRAPHRAGRMVTATVGIGAVAAAVVLIATGAAIDGRLGWGPLRADRATALLSLVTLATATVVTSFATRSLDRDGRTVRFFAAIGVLVTGTTLFTLAAHPLAFAAGWVVAGWALVSLMGFDRSSPAIGDVRRRMTTSLALGDAALVAALVVTWAVVGGSPLDETAIESMRDADLAGVAMVDVVGVLLVVAALSRSAITPFHRWLVGTIAAPTPVSAVVHAGFVSGGGILLIRTSDVFVASAPAVLLAFVAAAVTLVFASSVSIARPDVKGSLAWSTVAQMAFMIVQCAVGAFSSAVFHIAGHGMYKAARFLGAGDTVAADVRAHRRPHGGPALSPTGRIALAAGVSTLAVGFGAWLVPPLVNRAGQTLIVVFAWITAVSALHGWLSRHPFSRGMTALTGSVATIVGVMVYLVSLRTVEGFLKPALDSPVTAVGPVPLGLTIAGVALALAVVAHRPGSVGTWVGEAAARWRVRWSEPVTRVVATAGSASPISAVEIDEIELAEIRADVASAADVVSPMWPLSSFVAVNPLGDLETRGFDDATLVARRWRRARTHLSLEDFRADHARGVTRLADLDDAARHRFAEVCARRPMRLDGRLVQPIEVILADLMHGPDTTPQPQPRTALERREAEDASVVIDRLVAEWTARHLTRSRPGQGLVARCRDAAATRDPRLASIAGPTGLDWLATLDDDPAAVIAAAFSVLGVGPAERQQEMRGHLSRLAGWSGLAKWRAEWAGVDERRPVIAPIDIVAVRAAIEAAVIHSGDLPDEQPTAVGAGDTEPESLEQRVQAALRVLAPNGGEGDQALIRSVLVDVPADSRPAVWLRAQEHAFDERLLGSLDRGDSGQAGERPAVQAVFCIDVRSEGLRRRLEETPGIETLGFAGFFGVPLSVKRLGWDHSEPRCPVLVAPSVSASEQPHPDAIGAISASLGRESGRAGVTCAHDTAKAAPGGPFALAEALGWLTGVAAGLRTLRPPRAVPPAARSTWVALDDSVLVEQRVFAAEAVLRTMGLVDAMAPLVLLCGHTSRTVNNPHASALDCGACGGAAGDDNAMVVAALLNSPDVRHGLVERGIEVPDDTWFVAGVHDTASDHVSVLDRTGVPASHLDALRHLEDALDSAGAALAAARSAHLPGPPARVRDRGVDWAQVRPEWGLAGAAAFVIGPRSATQGIDLEGRVFLHGYDADQDPSGRVLETIMTAPLVVAHWISAQYYFSTVDPEVFGAGDKLMHNPIGSIGVVTGDGGDLRVGLPIQSTHVDGRRQHQPLRLLAVIQADLTTIEEIISRHRILQTLVSGSWIRIAARSHPEDPWSVRSPEGTWIADRREPTSTLHSPFDDRPDQTHDSMELT